MVCVCVWVGGLLLHICIFIFADTCLHPLSAATRPCATVYYHIYIDFLSRSLTVRVAISGLQWCKVGVAVSSITPDTPTWEHFVSQVDLSTWSGLCVLIVLLLTGYARV